MLNIFKSQNDEEITIFSTDIKINYDDPLIIKIQENLNIDQQDIFIKSFYSYLNCDQTKDYIVNLEHVFKIIGFTHKKNAKRTLENNFVKDEDYKLTLLPSEHGQFATEIIMLNIDTFKNLCMLAKTKRGKEIRKYYVKMEEIMMEYTKEQLQAKELEYQQQLREKEQKELEYQQQLEAKEQELVRYKNKTYEEIQKNNHVYVIKTDGGYKVGKTKDINNRIKGLQTGNVKDIEVVLDFKTSNSDLLEKVVHYILDRYRCNSNREFFDCDIDYIKNVVTVLGYTIDTLKSTYQHISKDDLIIKVRENVNLDRNNLPCYVDALITQDFIEPNQISAFDYWLNKNIIYKKNAVLKLQDTIEIYIGNKISTRHLGVYRKKIEKYVKENYRNIEWGYKQFWIGDIKYKGWKNLQIV